MADSLEQSETKRREFIANVSHELKTPMTTISGFADGILDGTIPPESEKKYLQIISSETKRLARLVRSMLELSRLQAKDRATLLKNSFDISEQLRLTLITFADKIDQKHLEVVFNVPEEAIKVLGDVDAITQVIYNLLDNAIKFSRENSPLTISLWKDSKKVHEACDCLRLTAADLKELGVIDWMLPEHDPKDFSPIFQSMEAHLAHKLPQLMVLSGEDVAQQRYAKFRVFGTLNGAI